MTLPGTVRGVEVPPKHRESEAHAHKCRGRCGKRPVFLALDAAHDTGHELAQQNNGEQADPFRIVRRIRWHLHAVLHGEPGSRNLDEQRYSPNPVTFRRIEKGGRHPEGRSKTEADGIVSGEPACLRNAASSQILQYENY